MKPSDWAWLTLAAAIIAYEAAAPPGELLSEAMDRYRTRRPIVTLAGIGLVAAHLARVLPPTVDPLHRFAVWVAR